MTENAMEEALLVKAAEGNFARVRMSIRQGTDAHYQDRNGWTALMRAANNGHVGVCQLLLQCGCLSEMRNSWGDTALHRASYWGHREVVRLLVHSGANVNAQNQYGNTPSHDASTRGHVTVMEELFDYGADYRIVNGQERSVLEQARYYEQKEAVDFAELILSGERKRNPIIPALNLVQKSDLIAGDVQDLVQDLLQKIEQMSNERDEILLAHRTEVEDLTRDKNALTRRILSNPEQRTPLAKRNERLHDDVQFLRRQLEEKNKTLSQLAQRSSTLRQRGQQLFQENNRYQQRLELQTKEMDQLRQQIQDLQQRRKRQGMQLEQLRRSNEQLTKDNLQLNHHTGKLMQENSRLLRFEEETKAFQRTKIENEELTLLTRQLRHQLDRISTESLRLRKRNEDLQFQIQQYAADAANVKCFLLPVGGQIENHMKRKEFTAWGNSRVTKWTLIGENYLAQEVPSRSLVPSMRNRHVRNRGRRVRTVPNDHEEIRRKINDVNRTDEHGNTALWFAVELTDRDLSETLLCKGADPNTRNRNGDTVCHLAARIERFDILELLVKYKADLSIRNNDGHDVLTVAVMFGRTTTGKETEFVTKVRSLERGQCKDRQFVAACGNEGLPSWMKLAGEERYNDRPLETNISPIDPASEHIKRTAIITSSLNYRE
ncbi:ankyrin repeat domain-containing protein 17-like [Corticium candelabrum]|uniref:ankyrin repeat domain-containing protein 17-like n=1 Tax=Corticium candelabrum TaxID=121492 RepID=UPI002E26550A|nr:ankyrin repeat domain-containing protein 17-like [Corticium candelabrum]